VKGQDGICTKCWTECWHFGSKRPHHGGSNRLTGWASGSSYVQRGLNGMGLRERESARMGVREGESDAE